MLKVIISKVYFNASTKNNVKKSKLVQIWLLLLEELNKIKDDDDESNDDDDEDEEDDEE